VSAGQFTRSDRRPVTLLDGDFTVFTVPGRAQSEVAELAAEAAGVGIDDFRHAMRALPGGVVMVTTRIDGRPWGLTISSCCSVTAEPPRLLISLQKRTASCRQIELDGLFGIGILSASHRSLAEFGAKPGVAKFIDEHCHGDACSRLSSPIIAGALRHLDCKVSQVHAIGDHRLIVGVIVGVRPTDAPMDESPPSPLVYFNREFWALGPTAPVERGSA
jgi:flavin reductase (DIM6/NTAB) family NADH-FMN oxidoreductase RutF